MGDRYDIPGLRDYCCTTLQLLFDIGGISMSKHELKIWSMAYEHSRASDNLRKVLVVRIRQILFAERGGTSPNRQAIDSFIEKSPELACVLLKELMDHFWRWARVS